MTLPPFCQSAEPRPEAESPEVENPEAETGAASSSGPEALTAGRCARDESQRQRRCRADDAPG